MPFTYPTLYTTFKQPGSNGKPDVYLIIIHMWHKGGVLDSYTFLNMDGGYQALTFGPAEVKNFIESGTFVPWKPTDKK